MEQTFDFDEIKILIDAFTFQGKHHDYWKREKLNFEEIHLKLTLFNQSKDQLKGNW